MRPLLPTLVFAVLGTAACSPPEQGPLMRPGEDCLRCHTSSPDSEDPDATPWTLAGTVFRDPHAAASRGVYAAEVQVTDKAGKVVTLRTGGTGNFYTAEPLEFPVQVEVRAGGLVARMADAPTGRCNGCHAVEPQDGAAGRIFIRP